MARSSGLSWVVLVLAVAVSVLLAPIRSWCATQEELIERIGTDDAEFLLGEIGKIQPPHAIRQLASFPYAQEVMGGGFCGCMPRQAFDAENLPLPVDERGRLELAMILATQHEINLLSLQALGIPTDFMPLVVPEQATGTASEVTVTFDTSVPESFLAALEDGRVMQDEAASIAALPCNRELALRLQQRCEDTASLTAADSIAFFVSRAASSRALDRIWCWLHPMNHLGYADLALNADEYREALERIAESRQQLADAVGAQVAPFVSSGIDTDMTVALSVCCPSPHWMTDHMAAINVEHLKGGWEHLVREAVAAVVRWVEIQVQPEFSATAFDAGTAERPGPETARAALRRAVDLAVFEGVAAFASAPADLEADRGAAAAGAAMIESLVAATSSGTPEILDSLADPTTPSSRRTLCAFGRYAAALVADHDGCATVMELLRRGPSALLTRAAAIEAGEGGSLLSGAAIDLVQRLARAATVTAPIESS